MATASAPRLEPVTLEGSDRPPRAALARSRPTLSPEVALDPAIWRWTIARPTSEAELRAWAETAIAARAAGTELPFATIDRASGRPIGSSRYMNIALDHRRIEIGWTWVGTAFQRTGANREAKLLMLSHAFDTLGCRRVEFKTDALNEKSRTALLGIGAQFEGSSAITWSCPMAGCAIPPTTASSTANGRPFVRRSRPACDTDAPRGSPRRRVQLMLWRGHGTRG
jgi:Acetyltransferases, including N-acetylases of ribosomal proteins